MKAGREPALFMLQKLLGALNHGQQLVDIALAGLCCAMLYAPV